MVIVQYPPYCGAEFGGAVAGRPVICDSETHPETVQHRNSESGYAWWSFAGYPRSGGT